MSTSNWLDLETLGILTSYVHKSPRTLVCLDVIGPNLELSTNYLKEVLKPLENFLLGAH